MLLVVAESSGSSPGRRGYKMGIGADGELTGSIGGGVMEVNLVEQSRALLSVRRASGLTSFIKQQTHQKNALNASGMICSGKQTVIFKLLTSKDAVAVDAAIDLMTRRKLAYMLLSPEKFIVGSPEDGTQNAFEKNSDTEFIYTERLGSRNILYIIGGGHCSLALSELMSKMDFRICVFDDRPELNTIEKNEFADEIEIIESYEAIADHIESAPNVYVVVMTIGYAYDKLVIRKLLDKDFKYFGVLGSKAKMGTLMKELRAEGYDEEKLKRIRTPVGIPINSRTPEEIAVSIAAEIIAVKNR